MVENQKEVNRIKKRDGSIVLFNKEKIANALTKAFESIELDNKRLVELITQKVAYIIHQRFGNVTIPTVEQVQDIVENVLIDERQTKVAKSYILHRERHQQIRDVKKTVSKTIDIIEGYVNAVDWRVKENSNMAYSLQGLNNHIATSLVARYWLSKIYDPEVSKVHIGGDLHIHDLGTLGPYCVGWDLKDFLTVGFKGVYAKTESRPPNHFRTALGQIVNFFYTIQGEVAGAVAFSNFDTYLAPFIKHDKLGYKAVKQALQEFLYNMNVPTRVGFQCLSEDTEILTVKGWKKHYEIKKGMTIKTFNIEKSVIENKKVKSVFRKKYNGVMFNLKNRIQDQLISPGHRVVRKKFNSNKYALEPIEKVLKLKSPFIVPVSAKNLNKESPVSNEQIKLIAWIVGEGSIEKPGKYRCCYRVSIYQSAIKNKKNYQEIKNLLNHFKLKFSEYTQRGLGKPVQRMRLDAASSKVIHKWFDKKKIDFIPDCLLNMGQKQSKLFINTYLKAEGFELETFDGKVYQSCAHFARMD